MEVVFTARLTSGPMALDEREVLAAGLFQPDALPPGLLPSHRELIRLALLEAS